MPELPEVETVRRQLARVLEGARIVRVETSRPNYFFVTSPSVLKNRLMGRRVSALRRHGKYLLADLDDGAKLLLHLGMTGQFVAHSLPQDGHVHVVLHLGKKRCITLRDVRKFGKIEWIPPGKTSKRLLKLGPDALELSSEELQLRLKKRRLAIKPALLDQGVWAGVGNIYADEGLFRAGIRPQKPANRLSQPQVDRLRRAIVGLLREAIAQGGSTINDYVRPDGELGGFQDFHQVYGKAGLPCPNCTRPIVRTVLGGRGTHFCRHCQK